MINITLLSLNLFSITSNSPLLTLYPTQKGLQESFVNLHLSRMLTSTFYSSMTNYQVKIINSEFSHSLSSVVNFNSDDDDDQNCFLYSGFHFTPNSPIGGQLIQGSRSYFTSGCGNIAITGCLFNYSRSNEMGGAVFIQQNCLVTIHNTIFNSCSSPKIGGACFIAKEFKTGAPNFYSDPLPHMNIQYCCFQNCFGGPDLYGVAIYSSATESILYYASTANCPGENGNRVGGAQFDLQATNVTSQYVNATGAHSHYCGGIEYRDATEGFFRFQTISYMNCMFSVAYTNIKTKNLDLYESNIMKITLTFEYRKDDPLYSGLIHVRYTNGHTDNNITIERFCFVDNTFSTQSGDQSRIISRGTLDKKVCNYPIILDNCYYDCSNDMVAVTDGDLKNYLFLIDCHPNSKKLNDIPQLNLGECKGKVTAAPLTPFPTPFPTSSPLPIGIHEEPGKSNQENSKKIAIIAGASAAGAAAVAAAVVGTVFFIKKKPPQIEDLDTVKNTKPEMNQENPLYDKKAEEDPFKDDFDK